MSFKNHKELFEHLLNGGKVRGSEWDNGVFIHFSDGELKYEDGSFSEIAVLSCPDEFEKYEEPKKKVKLYPALIRDSIGTYFITEQLYSDVEKAREANGKRFVNLLTDWSHEIVVEE